MEKVEKYQLSQQQIAVLEKITKDQPKGRIGIWGGNSLSQIWAVLKKCGYQPFMPTGSYFGPRHEGISIAVLSPKARVLGHTLQKCLLDSGTNIRLVDDVRIVESFHTPDASPELLEIEPGI
jgi:hypothetical protein